MKTLQPLAIVAVVATYVLIVVGAAVRVTGSGLGCPDWPLCHGGLIPPLEFTAIMEYSHRLVGAIVSVLILATVAVAWIAHRGARSILIPATVIPFLLAFQIVLGAVVVMLHLEPMAVLVHLGFAILIIGLLVWLAVAAGPRPRLIAAAPAQSGFHRLAWVTVGAVLLLILSGAYVRATGAGWACVGFPDCNGQAFPFGAGMLVDIHLAHRTLAYGVAVLVGVTLFQAWRMQSHVPAVMAAATALGITLVAQIAIGATVVSSGLPALVRGMHVAGAAAVWLSAVALASLAQRSASSACSHEPSAVSPERSGDDSQPSAQPLQGKAGWSAYLALTKPRVVSLLLVTTLATMFIAAEGLPPLSIVLFTLIGGALSAGGANAINCFIDRDIDRLMPRTVLRPIPSGVITPSQGLRFGLALAVLSFAVLTVFVNLLAAVLALGAFAFYVFVYTGWLKRSTPQNIVIGGAAGAMPPLIGWAAVTGEISLLAVFLFAIIFYWTPPHFWALALLMKREYAKAGVPMLPVVRGDDETRKHILLYTLQLVALTLILVPLQMLGLFYLFAASTLGVLFIYFAARLLREASSMAASVTYRYSLAYLALLFTAIVLDQRLFV